MFIGINLFLIGISYYSFDPTGLVFCLILFGVAAVESAIGLSLFYVFYMKYRTIYIHELEDIAG